MRELPRRDLLDGARCHIEWCVHELWGRELLVRVWCDVLLELHCRHVLVECSRKLVLQLCGGALLDSSRGELVGRVRELR